MMKGHISLGDFIRDVKRELVEAQDNSGNAFFDLHKVQLEVSFVLDAKAKAGGKLIVVELGGEATARQTHKVTLTLEPLLKPELVTHEMISKTQEEAPPGDGVISPTARPKNRPMYGGYRRPSQRPKYR